MKKLLLLTILICIQSSFSIAQESKIQTSPISPNHVLHYYLDFEIKDYTLNNTSTQIINRIDFDEIETLRQDNIDTEFYSNRIDKTIIIYSREKVAQNHLINNSNSNKH